MQTKQKYGRECPHKTQQNKEIQPTKSTDEKYPGHKEINHL